MAKMIAPTTMVQLKKADAIFISEIKMHGSMKRLKGNYLEFDLVQRNHLPLPGKVQSRGGGVAMLI